MNTKGNKAKKFFGRRFWKMALILFVIFTIIGTPISYIYDAETTETELPQHSTYFYANDFSGVLSKNTEEFLTKTGDELCQAASGAQIVVAVVPNTGSMALEDYSIALAREWGIGDADLNNGVLILFTTDEAHARLEIGYGLEGCLNDAKCGRILDTYAVDDIQSGNFNAAAVNTYLAVADVVCGEYNIEDTFTAPDITETRETDGPADMSFPELIVTKNEDPIPLRIWDAFLILWIYCLFPYLFILIFLRCVQLTPKDQRRMYYDDRFGRGGGFGGGSGGFGGFSGGGGSFGGGGASR